MKMLRYGVAICLLTGLGACSGMMGGSGSSGSRTVAATQPTVAPEMVRQVQSKLRDGGYYKQGPVDGVWGSGTENAVRSFQHDHNLTSSGQLDVPTLQALNLNNPPAGYNDTAPVRSTDPNYNPPPAQSTTPTYNRPADTTTAPPR